MDGVRSWFDYMSSRTDHRGWPDADSDVCRRGDARCGDHGVVVAVLTMRHTFAKELALAISSVFLTIPSLALFTIFVLSLALIHAVVHRALLARSCRFCEIRRPGLTRSAQRPGDRQGHGYDALAGADEDSVAVGLAGDARRYSISALLTVGISAIATLVAGGSLGDFIERTGRLPLPNSLEAIWTSVLLSLALTFVIDSCCLASVA